MAEIRAQLLRAVLLLRAGEQQQAAELAYSQLQLANSLGMRRIFVDLTPVVRESLRTLAPLFRGAEVVALMREVQPPGPSDAETPGHPQTGRASCRERVWQYV